MDIGVNSSSSAAKVSRPILVIHRKDENRALCICLVNPALGSLSWNGTRTRKGSPGNSLEAASVVGKIRPLHQAISHRPFSWLGIS